MGGVVEVRLPVGRGGPAAEPAGVFGAAVAPTRGRGWQPLAGGEAVPARADLLQPEGAVGGAAAIASSGAGEQVRIVGDGDVDPEADRVRIVGDAWRRHMK